VPRLTAPVTTSTDFVQATGNSPVSLASYGGGGRGRGIGPGDGDGVGPGSGGGTGGGVYGPGSGVTPPAMLREVKPAYTSEAMRLKIQGSVELEIIIQADGTVASDIRVLRSLDKVHGLDEAAKAAARGWLFRPAKDRDGKAVPYKAPLILDFRLH
jgi:protein TonB